ncbi:sensor histidine kinase [Frigoribacterium sp. 2-23]|uniref:sensor histidine kinase n=1 Tax=Frigoribacterium sp. 2-23 TaxID=3415006 RepID=UPI003C6EE3FC
MAERTGHRRSPSLRLRITVAAVLAVALTLGVFTLVFALVQRAVLDDAPRSAAAADVARAVAALEGGSSAAVAVAGKTDGSLVLVVDETGAVLATGGDVDLRGAASSLAATASGTGGQVRLDDEDFVVVRSGAEVETTVTSTPAVPEPVPSTTASAGGGSEGGSGESGDDSGRSGSGSGSGRDAESGSDDASPAPASTPSVEVSTVTTPYTVVAARSLGEARAASSASLTTLGIAVPVALVVLGVTTWLVVGRALRPVESMRRDVADITAASLGRRLPEPPGSDEIARLARTLNGMLDRLDASARAQRRFVGDASHELKTPLATIRQHAEVALLHPESIDGRALAGTVLGEEARLTDLVQGLLVLARADEGALGATRHDVDLDDLVVQETTRARGDSDRVVDAASVGPARVSGDAGLLGQVVHNLVANATRHAESRIAIGLRDDGGVAVLTVDDDGAGVADSDRERVFERFVRLDEARARDAGGSGLGLAIVREIIRVHDGTVSVESSPLGGARFVVRLPIGRGSGEGLGARH